MCVLTQSSSQSLLIGPHSPLYLPHSVHLSSPSAHGQYLSHSDFDRDYKEEQVFIDGMWGVFMWRKERPDIPGPVPIYSSFPRSAARERGGATTNTHEAKPRGGDELLSVTAFSRMSAWKLFKGAHRWMRGEGGEPPPPGNIIIN